MRLMLTSLQAGAEAAEGLIHDVFRVDVSKILDPLNDRDFVTISNQLRKALQRAAAPEEAQALRRALARLDVNWPNINAVRRARVIAAAARAFLPVPGQILPELNVTFRVNGTRIVKGTRKSIRSKFNLKIPASTSVLDKKIPKLVTDMQTNFVRDEFGRRQVGFSRSAREIVSKGLEQGLGRDAITANLRRTLGARGLRRSKNYWNVVSMSFANHARTFTEISGFEEAKIDRYRWDSILDEVTTDECRFMHNKVFSTQAAVEQIQKLDRLKDPEAIKEEKPWMRIAQDPNGNRVLFIERNGRKQPIAQVTESAVGTKDERGRFSRPVSNKKLEEFGVALPPIHGLCRSTVTPEV